MSDVKLSASPDAAWILSSKPFPTASTLVEDDSCRILSTSSTALLASDALSAVAPKYDNNMFAC